MDDLELVFVENAAEVAAAVPHVIEGVSPVALSPEASYHLERRGLPYTIPEAIVSDDELQEVGAAIFASLGEVCEQIDATLQRNVPYLADAHLRPAWLHLYHLNVLFGGVVTRLHCLRKVIAATRAVRVWGFAPAPDQIDSDLVFPKQSLNAQVLPLAARAESVTYAVLEHAATKAAPGSQHRKWTIMGLKPALGRSWHKLRYFRRWGLKSMRPRPRSAAAIVVLQESADLQLLIAELAQRCQFNIYKWDEDAGAVGVWPVWLPDILSPDGVPPGRAPLIRTEQAWAETRGDPVSRHWFLHDSVDWWPLVESRMAYFVRHIVPHMVSVHRLANNTLERLAPKAVLTSAPFSYSDRIVCHAARHRGITVVDVQHGGNYGYLKMPTHAYQDLAHADVFLSYGPGVPERLLGYDCNDSPTRIINTGSPSLDKSVAECWSPKVRARVRQRLGIDAGRPAVLFPMTNMCGNYRYFPHVSRPDNLQFDLHKAVVGLFEHYSDTVLLVKLTTREWAWNPIADYIQDRRISNVEIIRDGSFVDLLPAADAVLLDWPATTLLEALTTRVPILSLFDQDSVHLFPEAQQLLEGRVQIALDSSTLLQELEGWLRSNTFRPIEHQDDAFLRQYGTYRSDGKSLERASHFVAELAGVA